MFYDKIEIVIISSIFFLNLCLYYILVSKWWMIIIVNNNVIFVEMRVSFNKDFIVFCNIYNSSVSDGFIYNVFWI